MNRNTTIAVCLGAFLVIAVLGASALSTAGSGVVRAWSGDRPTMPEPEAEAILDDEATAGVDLPSGFEGV
ncbi:MAG: hypothetical protein ACYSWX_10085 [Planctomycetota bacterium]|jgi:hypothetical protein